MRARPVLVALTLLLPACSSASTDGNGGNLAAGTGPLATEVPAALGGTPAAIAPVDAATATTTSATTTPDTTTSDTAAPDTAAPDTEPRDTTAHTTPDTTAGVDSSLTVDRPFDVFTPSSYDGTTAFPLVVLLHGYTASGDLQEAYFGLQPLAESRGFLYVHPDGTVDARGQHFWNATDACCDLGGTGVDDVAYLSAVIAQVEAEFDVDPKRIFLIGHSNGGFMSYRMACDRSDLIAAIASVAGATFADTGECAPSEPVSVLQIHGTSDQTIAYDGGQILGHPFPSASATVAAWAGYDRCDTTPTAGTNSLDLERTITGDETTTLSFADCPSGTDVELWTVNGGSHVPSISDTFMPDVIDFLFAHPKP